MNRKKMFYITFLSTIFFSLPCFAQYQPRCADSYFYDSYSLGMYQAYIGSNKITFSSKKQVDLNCAVLGFHYGKDLRARHCKNYKNTNDRCLDTECGDRMREGQKSGFSLGDENAVECFAAGYKMGVSKLRYAAREQDLTAFENMKFSRGKQCLDAYYAGHFDGREGRVESSPNSNPEKYCYELGYFEWQFVRPLPKKE